MTSTVVEVGDTAEKKDVHTQTRHRTPGDTLEINGSQIDQVNKYNININKCSIRCDRIVFECSAVLKNITTTEDI